MLKKRGIYMKLTINEQKMRDLYLRKLALGEIQGPLTGKPSRDKVWLKYYSEANIKSNVYHQTAYELLKTSLTGHESQTALNYLDNKTTYGQLSKNIDKVAQSYATLGVKKGDIVTLCMPTTPETVYSIYALNKLGAVANLVDLRTSPAGLKDYLQEVDSKFVLCFDMVIDNMKEIVDDTNVKTIIQAGPVESLPLPIKIGYNLKHKGSSKQTKANCMSWSTFIKSGRNADVETTSYEENRPAYIVHTSGTTSKPKAIVLSDDNLNAMVLEHEASGIKFSRNQKFLNIVPPFVAYGLVNSLHMPLCLGMNNILIPKEVEDDFPDLVLKYKPNHILGIPMHWEILMNSPKIKDVDLSFFETMVSGGDVLSSSLEKRINAFLKEHNCEHKISKGYGMTEMSSAVTFSKDECNKVGTVGVPFVKNTIGVFKPDTTEELGYNEEGEICVQSPTTMIEYYNNPTATNKLILEHNDGEKWVHTGDLGYIDNDGVTKIDGRIKRQIIRKGFKVSPSAIEDVILSHPAIENCAVVGVDDLYQGHIPTACVVLKQEYINDKDKIENELIDLCSSKLPDYCLPEEYVFRDSFPHKLSGKMDFVKLI